jgi:hypothetical protein
LDVYTQWIPQRGSGEYNVHSCNCPSRSNPCKHAAMSLALLDVAEEVELLHLFYWEDTKVGEVADIPTREQLQTLGKSLL